MTHDQEEALAVADRVGVMNRGRLEQLAPPSQLYANPASHFVAEFVGLNNKVAALVSDRRACSRRRRPDDRGVDRLRARAGPGAARVGDHHRRRSRERHRGIGQLPGTGVPVYVDVDDAELLMAAVPALAVRLHPGDRVAVGVRPTPLLVVATPSQPSVATA